MITHKDLMLLAETQAPFERRGWIFELKYDGFRVLAQRSGSFVSITSRRGTDLTACFPEIVECLVELPDLVLDGELVVLDARGHPQFERLARRARMSRFPSVDAAAKEDPAMIFAFDLLELRGKDMRSQPLLKRKAALEKVLKGSSRIRYLTHVGEDGRRLFAAAARLELEGIVAKRADSAYKRGRSRDWLKISTPAGKLAQESRSETWS
jgi:bifunctional non-homologous end joining protein LigD